MAATRIDIHAPGAQFDPEGYEFVDSFYLGMNEVAQREWAAFGQAVEQAERAGYRHGGPGRGGCDHCGANAIYVALMLHPASREWITIGETCLGGRFQASKADWDALRTRVKAAQQEAKVLAAYTEFVTANPIMIYATYADNIAAATIAGGQGLGYEGADLRFGNLVWKDKALNIVADIARKTRRTAYASERQIELVTKLLGEVDAIADEVPARLAKIQAEAAEKAAAPAWTPGRQEITGVVLSSKWVESDYGYGTSGTVKITVKLDNGQRVYGSLPRDLWGDGQREEKGRRITLTATVKPSPDDPAFGWYSRPTKAKWLD